MSVWIVSVGEAALDIIKDVRALLHWDRPYVMNGAVQDPNDIEAQLVHVGKIDASLRSQFRHNF